MLYECNCFWLSSSHFSVRENWINKCISDVSYLQKSLSLSSVDVILYDAGGGATEAALLTKLENMPLKLRVYLRGQNSNYFARYIEKKYPQANNTTYSDLTLHFACDTNTPIFTSHTKIPFKDLLKQPAYYASLWATEKTQAALHNALHGCIIDEVQMQYHFCSPANMSLYTNAHVTNWYKKRVVDVVFTTPPQIFWRSFYHTLYDKNQEVLDSIFTDHSFENIIPYITMLASACANQ